MKTEQDLAIGLSALGKMDRGVCAVSTDGVITFWGGRLTSFGIDATEAEGRLITDVLGPLIPDPVILQQTDGMVCRAMALGRAMVQRNVPIGFPATPGARFNLCVAPLAGGTPGAAILFEDITETVRVRERYERILNSTPDGIFVIDDERKVRLFNDACGRITGRSPESILRGGCTCDGVVQCHNEEGESYATSLCPAKAVFGGEVQSQSEEMLLTNQAGEERWIETNYSSVLGPSGEVEYVIGILRDVHDRKMLEEKLQQTEKLASFGQLVAGIAHEIKNPLAIIQSSLDILRSGERSTQQKAEALDFIGEEVRRMDERLRAFLAFARPRELRARSVLLAGWLKRRMESLASLFPGITFQLEAPSPEPLVNVDEEQLNQVLTNLILNAAEAMDGRGEIALRTRLASGSVLIEVDDSGPGIPEDQRIRIFDPFFTTKPNGTGLGLSICYQIILAHRGTIAVAPGRLGGTCFTVRLPSGARVEES